MLRMDSASLRKALEQLEQARSAQARWHEELLRALICRTDLDTKSIVAPFAHRNTRFGRWYYEDVPAEVREHALFPAIGDEHERLHRIAARLLRAASPSAPVARTNVEDLLATNARLNIQLDALRESIAAALKNRDTLTGACGRAEMLPELRELHRWVQREAQPCSLVFMDLDGLKHINDTYGHQVGDSVLTGAVRYVNEHLRSADRLFRYGGDEFLISLPGTDLQNAQAVVARIRDGLGRKLMVTGPGGMTFHVTASFGLALLDPEIDVAESIDRADQALMLAKTAGRNRAISWDSSVTTSTRWRQLKID